MPSIILFWATLNVKFYFKTIECINKFRVERAKGIARFEIQNRLFQAYSKFLALPLRPTQD